MSRPTVRTQIELPVPDLTPFVQAWTDTAAKASADAFAQAQRQWFQWWTDSANAAVEAWWAAVLPRR